MRDPEFGDARREVVMPRVLPLEYAADEMLFILRDAPQFCGGEAVKMVSCDRDSNCQATHICALFSSS